MFFKTLYFKNFVIDAILSKNKMLYLTATVVDRCTKRVTPTLPAVRWLKENYNKKFRWDVPWSGLHSLQAVFKEMDRDSSLSLYPLSWNFTNWKAVKVFIWIYSYFFVIFIYNCESSSSTEKLLNPLAA